MREIDSFGGRTSGQGRREKRRSERAHFDTRSTRGDSPLRPGWHQKIQRVISLRHAHAMGSNA
jgi:hypothetical protein